MNVTNTPTFIRSCVGVPRAWPSRQRATDVLVLVNDSYRVVIIGLHVCTSD